MVLTTERIPEARPNRQSERIVRFSTSWRPPAEARKFLLPINDKMPATHALYETSSGYALFTIQLSDEIAPSSFYASISDLSKFGKIASLLSFSPFKTAAQALENINDVSEGIVNDHLKTLLDLNLGGKKKILLAVQDPLLAKGIRDATGVECDISESSMEVLRGIRLHSSKLLTGLEENDMKAAQLGLGSSLKYNNASSKKS